MQALGLGKHAAASYLVKVPIWSDLTIADDRELRFGEAEALQFAAALASARQNVSEAGQ